MHFSWSAVIRTIGTAGDKYYRTIQSVLRQNIPPEEIIIVLPNGCKLDYVCGKERIVYSQKGMVTQRAIGINEAHSDYILVLDDDVEFQSDLIEKCHLWLQSNHLDCVLPGWGGTPVKYSLKTRIKGFIRGDLYTSRRESEWLDKVCKTTGHKVYVNSTRPDKCYLCQTGCFQIFFIKTDVAKKLDFCEETWLEHGSISSYAIGDDLTFFYKLYINEGRTAYCQNATYTHLDAAAGRKARNKLEERKIRYYTDRKNRYIFWRKFIWSQSNSFTDKILNICAWYGSSIGYILYTTAINLQPKYWGALKAMLQGISDGRAMYKDLKCPSSTQ